MFYKTAGPYKACHREAFWVAGFGSFGKPAAPETLRPKQGFGLLYDGHDPNGPKGSINQRVTCTIHCWPNSEVEFLGCNIRERN